jgi:hypothetical protein
MYGRNKAENQNQSNETHKKVRRTKQKFRAGNLYCFTTAENNKTKILGLVWCTCWRILAQLEIPSFITKFVISTACFARLCLRQRGGNTINSPNISRQSVIICGYCYCNIFCMVVTNSQSKWRTARVSVQNGLPGSKELDVPHHLYSLSSTALES